MKTTTMRLMFATAVLAVAACSASAQTLKAEIPMAFRAGGKAMQAGSYEIREEKAGGRTYISVRETGTGRSVLLAQSVKGDAPKAWRQAGNPQVSFVCAGESCTLNRLWNGKDDFSYEFTAPKPSGANVEAQTKVVTLAMIRVH